MKKIVALTINPAIDKSARIDHVVAERKLYCTDPHFEPGGGGVNVARAIKKLGGSSRLLYAAGGYTGNRLEELLAEEGLDQRRIPITGMTRESLAVLEEATGLQYRFGMPGPTLHPEEWLQCLKEVSALDPPPDYLVASGSLPPGIPTDAYAQVAKIGKEHGARVIVDVSGDALKEALGEGVYLIKPNIREFKELSGKDVKEELELEAEALEMVRKGWCEVLVISLGSAGALLVSAENTEHIRPPTVPIISKVGAGDSMVAGLVLQLARGASLREACYFGVASGAAAVMTPGSELCRREDAERLYAKIIKKSE
ncbi:1-phosphofructokinase family hexose kinase [Desulfobulbus alkaliphilus]|uniref:1-phosphofructokinase family hexose kinase n=1 Tax=Desulfobulbus alkaliphilus TaxID=869814 RepID=UPI00196525DE|nr:1-phosphofructokinase family hexose kinase [Desulfobulbus alkaliphilus]MBM9537525.1 1-phosphofructokinase family hexose kinase [Desulfobulbus alkaliphilus]